MENRPRLQQERGRVPLTLKDMQYAVVQHSDVIGKDETVAAVHEHFIEESTELAQALETGNRRDIAGEIADIYIFLARLAYTQGIDVESAVWGKLERNYAKYNPYELQGLVDGGMSHEEARLTLKQRWNKKDDGKYVA